MNREQLKKLEKDLWAAADKLQAFRQTVSFIAFVTHIANDPPRRGLRA